MARTCDICAKHTQVGSQVQRRGIAKKQGGIGIRITSREKRLFKPNIQNIKARTVDGKPIRARVCTSCLKAGKIAKR